MPKDVFCKLGKNALDGADKRGKANGEMYGKPEAPSKPKIEDIPNKEGLLSSSPRNTGGEDVDWCFLL